MFFNTTRKELLGSRENETRESFKISLLVPSDSSSKALTERDNPLFYKLLQDEGIKQVVVIYIHDKSNQTEGFSDCGL